MGKGFDPNQPRADDGQWSKSGGIGRSHTRVVPKGTIAQHLPSKANVIKTAKFVGETALTIGVPLASELLVPKFGKIAVSVASHVGSQMAKKVINGL